MSQSLQRIFAAEREGRKRLEEAKSRAEAVEAKAREEADKVVAEADNQSKEILTRAREDARRAADERRSRLAAELDERVATWRKRYESNRDRLVQRIVSAALGGEDSDSD